MGILKPFIVEAFSNNSFSGKTSFLFENSYFPKNKTWNEKNSY